MRREPVCFRCHQPVQADPVYEAACGHDADCPSMVWHPLCLMEWRDMRKLAPRRARRLVLLFLDDHRDR